MTTEEYFPILHDCTACIFHPEYASHEQVCPSNYRMQCLMEGKCPLEYTILRGVFTIRRICDKVEVEMGNYE